jgi:chemotaxis protein histidine kinase CheA/CheY-like chemotaxis protein
MLPEDQKRILGYFIEEAKDHLNTIEQGLLNLQATIEDPEMVNEVFRAAHSVKGGAAMLGLESIQQTSHRLEDYFKILKESPVQADRALESMLLQIFDGLQEQLEQLQGPFGLTDDKAQEIMATIEPVFGQVHQHLERLVQAVAVAAPAKRPAEPSVVAAPVAAAPAAAMAHSETSALQLVFKSDVPAYLRTMLGLFKQADNETTRQELQSICQQLARIGEQFELPGWCALVDAARRVIGNDQQTFRTLAPLIIKEIKSGQDLVLGGQPNRITVSLAMQDLLPPEPVDDRFQEESLDALLEEALSDNLEEVDLTDLFATAEAEPGAEDLALSDPDAWFDAVGPTDNAADADGDLAAVFEDLEADTSTFETVEASMPIIGTGPEVGAAELNSLADLFEGEVSELDDVWEEEEIAEGAAEEAQSSAVDISNGSEFADLLLADDGADLQPLDGDDELVSLFGSTLLDDPASVSPDLDEIDLDGMEIAIASPDLDSSRDILGSSDDSSALEELGDLWDNPAPDSTVSDAAAPAGEANLDFFFDPPEQPLNGSPQADSESDFEDFFAETAAPQPALSEEDPPHSADALAAFEDSSSAAAPLAVDDPEIAADLWDDGTSDGPGDLSEPTDLADLTFGDLGESSPSATDSGAEDLAADFTEDLAGDLTGSFNFESFDPGDALTTAAEDDLGFSELDFGSLDLDMPESTASQDEDFADELGLLSLEDDPLLTGPTAEISDFDLNEVADGLEADAIAPPEPDNFDFADLDLDSADEVAPEPSWASEESGSSLEAEPLTGVPNSDLAVGLEDDLDFEIDLAEGLGLEADLDLATDSPSLSLAEEESSSEPFSFEDAAPDLADIVDSTSGAIDGFDLDLEFDLNEGSADSADSLEAVSAPESAALWGEDIGADDLDFDGDLGLEEGLAAANPDAEDGLAMPAAEGDDLLLSPDDDLAAELPAADALGLELEAFTASPADSAPAAADDFLAEEIGEDLWASEEPTTEANAVDNLDLVDSFFEMPEISSSAAVAPDLTEDLLAVEVDLENWDQPASEESLTDSFGGSGLNLDDPDPFFNPDQPFDLQASDLEAAPDLGVGDSAVENSALEADSLGLDDLSEFEFELEGSTGEGSEGENWAAEADPLGLDDLSEFELEGSTGEGSEGENWAAEADPLGLDDLSEFELEGSTGEGSEGENWAAEADLLGLDDLSEFELEGSTDGGSEVADLAAEADLLGLDDLPEFEFEGSTDGESEVADLAAEADLLGLDDLPEFGFEAPAGEDSGLGTWAAEADLLGLDDLSEPEREAPNETAAESAVSGAEADLGFDELDQLLGDDDIAADPETVPATSAAFEPPAVETDDFSDLDALLEEDLSDSSLAPGFVSGSAALEPSLENRPENGDDEFEDLEKLLEEADQLGGSAPAIGLRRSQAAAARRLPRRAGALVDQTMRVSVKHLDNLSNLVGELVVNRNSLEQDQERLRQFLDNLLFQVQQLNDVGQRMRDLYERSLLESSLISSRQPFQTAGVSSDSSHATGVTFDALEMDRFTGFHTLSQEMIELIVRVRESSSDIAFTIESTDQITRQFRQVTTQLQEGLNKARMVPFAQTADRLPRAVRDISLKCGKEAKLVVEGRDTLIDKMILERLYDPMTHLVNNAITHGIETPEERLAAGKPREGTITVRAFYQGNQTVIYIADDGAGIHADLVKEKAVKRGLITPAEARAMNTLDVYELLFLPGFSTRDQADDFAGRGVGMDVVRTALSEIRGSVTIDSEMGKGTSFTIRLPLTLSISKALSCVNNQARLAFPMDGVEDMFDAPRERVQTDSQGQSCILWRDTLLPFRPLSDLLQFNRTIGRGRVYGGHQDDDIISIVVLRSANTFIALKVDQVIGEQEIVIKQLEGPVPKPTGIAGATVLGDGRVMPIADVLELIDLSMGRVRRDPSASLWSQPDDELPAVAEVQTKAEPTVLIVDDSITVRELLSMSFNKVGYRVEQARDGQEAWEKLRSGLPCDLVFCDIEMPRMDGLELLSRMQKDSALSQIPIAMLTSRGADRHRQMAVDLGAKGYFTKPYLEEMLLDAAQRMLNGENMVKLKGS